MKSVDPYHILGRRITSPSSGWEYFPHSSRNWGTRGQKPKHAEASSTSPSSPPSASSDPSRAQGAEQRVWAEQWNGFHRKPIQAVIFKNKWLRRNMIEVYKMRSSSEIVNRQWFFIICHYSRQKWNKMKLWTSSSKQPRRRTFPSQLIIKSYSSLPQRAASAKSINFFKRNQINSWRECPPSKHWKQLLHTLVELGGCHGTGPPQGVPSCQPCWGQGQVHTGGRGEQGAEQGAELLSCSSHPLISWSPQPAEHRTGAQGGW